MVISVLLVWISNKCWQLSKSRHKNSFIKRNVLCNAVSVYNLNVNITYFYKERITTLLTINAVVQYTIVHIVSHGLRTGNWSFSLIESRVLHRIISSCARRYDKCIRTQQYSFNLDYFPLCFQSKCVLLICPSYL